MGTVSFLKMHGLGNDFVVIDARRDAPVLAPAAIRAIAQRHTGIGFDQMLTIEPSLKADAFMRIHNANGGEVGACGNGARCVAWLLMRESGKPRVTIETAAGLINAERAADGATTVDMGLARLDWRDVPLSQAIDTLHLDLAVPEANPVLRDPVAVGMGNPHAVFFVPDAEAIDLAAVGRLAEHHALYPERTNVSVAQVLGRDSIRLRVWERGVGITLACGTAACATLVAAVRRGLTDRAAAIRLDGGPLFVRWREDGHVLMTGPVSTSFAGTLDPSALQAA
ncbi:MAG: diaminopimelate epimerase [Alphaproteobacteria bacterium]|nr:diaminopimelate epimerase [Alphaproteobacteria bacterium]